MGIISAMNVEIDSLIAKMENVKTEEISGIKYFNGDIGKSKITAAVCGIGKVNAAVCAQILIMKYAPQYIINIGVAGSISSTVGIRDIVVAASVVQHDIDNTPLGAPLGFIPKAELVQIPCSKKLNQLLLSAANNADNVKTGIVATGDRFIHSQRDIDFITENFKAVAVDEESGSIGHVCYINNVEFAAIRSISDNSDEDSHIVMFKNLEKSAETAIGLLMKIL
ncbi:MAG: 5'-methylthioadenosine/adenosylhomocysteine nucleosidase [Oscillospiraceae bacterium]|nr:5'-methylthioadenosine/adenosylhomocysteine nucleosidase [Oscillospiraceae bacterium]